MKRILYAIAVLVLLVLPYYGSKPMTLFSPYFNNNEWGTFIALWFAYLLVSVVAGWLLAIKTLPRPLLWGGFAWYMIGAALAAVMGLAAPPDFGPAMLEYPEREHFRYVFLLIAALLTVTGIVQVLRHKWREMPRWNRWIIIPLIPSLVEIFWEFTHQYLAYYGLKEWVGQGNNAADFGAHYFTLSVLDFGAFGRICQYVLIAWLALILVQGRNMEKWAFAVIVFFCMAGLTSSIIIITKGLHMPQGLEFLFLFFIPAAPLCLLYWEGLALLTTRAFPRTGKRTA